MKKDTKQRLFEVMSRLDSTFKPKLNENVEDEYFYPEEFGWLADYFNRNESKFDGSNEESTSVEHVFDVPKTEMNKYDIESIKNEYNQRSHGVEGNPGGIVSRTYSYVDDMGDFYRVSIITNNILDV